MWTGAFDARRAAGPPTFLIEVCPSCLVDHLLERRVGPRLTRRRVMSRLHCASLMRSDDSELNPRTTECAAPRRTQHRDRELGDERKVDRDAISAFDAERLQHVRELADLAIEVEVRQRAAVARLAFPDQRRLVTARSPDVTIDAVDARVDRATDEPLGVRRFPFEHLRPGRRPFELGRKCSPETFGILVGTRVDAFVVDVGLRAEFRRWWKCPVFLKEIGDICRWFLVCHGLCGPR
jgi:hypothetical protein